MERIQTLVVGAGVVGLACARALARAGREVVVVEAAGRVGSGTSSRNSEVVHAGIYYPAGSRKARHCVRGSRQLLEYCQERRVAHKVCGKFIVATSQPQLAALTNIKANAAKNGVQLFPLSPEEVRAAEDEVECVGALHSPRTSIVDSHGFMMALLSDAEDSGASCSLRTRICDGGQLLPHGGARIQVASLKEDDATLGDRFQLEVDEVVNCAGLAAPRVAAYIGVPASLIPKAHFCRGNYYALQGARPFSRLIYPVPEPNVAGLGVHATVDLAGSVRFGPDVEWLPERLPNGLPIDEAAYGAAAEVYKVDPERSQVFYSEVRRYWPGLADGALLADYSGIRPKLSGPGEPAADFALVAAGGRGPGYPPGVLNLFGIESPGLTAAMSLAEEVVEILSPGSQL